MPLKPFKILFVAFISALFGACGSGPVLTVCISYPKNHEFVCIDHNQKTVLVPYEESDKYVAFPPEDAKTLIEVCKLNNASSPEAKQVIGRYQSQFRHFFQGGEK